MNEKKRLKIASRGKRLAAFAIDEILPFVLGISMLVALLSTATTTYSYYNYGYGSYDSYGGYTGYNHGIGFIFGWLLCIVIALAYLGVQMYFYSKSQTIGKAIIGTQVVSSKTGEPIGFLKMLLRELVVKQASKAVFCIGYIWVLIDDRNRAWHDKILDTYVIDLKESALLNKLEKEQQPEPVEVTETPVPTEEPAEATDVADTAEAAETGVQTVEPVEIEEPAEATDVADTTEAGETEVQSIEVEE